MLILHSFRLCILHSYLDHHLLFASVEDGIYSLNLDDFENIEMFQVCT